VSGLGQTSILGLFGFGEVRYSDNDHGPARRNDNGMQETARHFIRTYPGGESGNCLMIPVLGTKTLPSLRWIHSYSSEDHRQNAIPESFSDLDIDFRKCDHAEEASEAGNSCLFKHFWKYNDHGGNKKRELGRARVVMPFNSGFARVWRNSRRQGLQTIHHQHLIE
jgi:hypothetical protein